MNKKDQILKKKQNKTKQKKWAKFQTKAQKSWKVHFIQKIQ